MDMAQKTLTVLAAAGQMLVLSGAALPAPLAFRPDTGGQPGSVSCQVPVDKLAALSLKALFTVTNNSVTLTGAADEYMEPTDLLHGVVIKVEADTASNPGKVTGLVYFQSGQGLRQIDSPEVDDVVFRREGSISGRIVEATPARLVMVTKDGGRVRIDTGDVKYVRSPRAFMFVIPLAAGPQLPDAAPFVAEAAGGELKPTVGQRSLPMSSIVPESLKKQRLWPDTTSDGDPDSYRRASIRDNDSPLPEGEEEDDPLTPVFKWQPNGISRFP